MSSRSLELGKYVGPSTAVELSLEAAETTLTSEIPLFCASVLCSPISSALITTTLETNLESIEVSALHVGRLGRMRYSLSGGITCQRAQRHDRHRCNGANAADASDGAGDRAGAPGRRLRAASPWAASIAPWWRLGARERNERYALAGELFPTQGLGIRLGYARWDGDEPLGETYELGATWYFKPSIGAQVVMSRTKSELPISTVRDVDTVALQLIGRL